MQKQKQKQKKNNQRGITLIAFVVTIIVLIILAGVNINMLVGDNGIITQAQSADERTERAAIEEKMQLAQMQLQMENRENTVNNMLEKMVEEGTVQEDEIDLIRIEDDGNAILKVKDVEINIGKINGSEPLLNDELEGNDKYKTFITKWKIEQSNMQIVLPIMDLYQEQIRHYDFTVDYGDGTVVQVTGETDPDSKHIYAEPGEYEVKITGLCEEFNFQSISDSKDMIIGIEQWGTMGLKHINFLGCSNLEGTIPIPVKNSFAQITSFDGFFTNCSKLNGHIPKNLFFNCPNVTLMGWIFNRCGELTGNIPERLFKYTPNITTVINAFAYTNLGGNIPEKLFFYNNKLENFQDTFACCKNLQGSIPESLFVNNTEAINFHGTFQNCSRLTGEIPKKIFENTRKAEDFRFTFTGCIGITGNAPELWKREGVINSTQCFKDCINLNNYNDIPSSWK